MKKLTHKELIDIVVAEYSENPLRRCTTVYADSGRSVGCAYSPKLVSKEGIVINPNISLDSKGCAIGMFMTKAQAKEADYAGLGIISLSRDLIPKKLAHFSIDFLCSIQDLHDTSLFWNSKGLSKLGKERVKQLRNRFEPLDNSN
jgi:hypothetical protein